MNVDRKSAAKFTGAALLVAGCAGFAAAAVPAAPAEVDSHVVDTSSVPDYTMPKSWVETDLVPSLEALERAAEKVRTDMDDFAVTLVSANKVLYPLTHVPEEAQRLGIRYKVTPYLGGVASGCGPYIGVNAFWCNADKSIYFDISLATFDQATTDFVLLHENAHGDDAAARSLGTRYGHGDESFADCRAGAGLAARGISPAGALSFVKVYGGNDPEGHGTSAQRAAAIQRGYSGGAGACNVY